MFSGKLITISGVETH